MELMDEQLAVLPEEARTKAWNALWKWRRGRYDAGDDVSREERTLHLMHGYATALLARQRDRRRLRRILDVAKHWKFEGKYWYDETLRTIDAWKVGRQRLRRVLGMARFWRRDALSLYKMCNESTRERDEARGGRNLRRKEAKEYWDRLAQALGWSAAWKAAAKEWRGKTDEAKAQVAVLVDAAKALLDDVMARHPDIRDVGFDCPHMGNLYEAIECLPAETKDTLVRLEKLEAERDELLRRLEEARPLPQIVRGLAYDTGWLAAKIELGHSETPESDNLDLQTLIERRNDAFHELEAALAGGEGE